MNVISDITLISRILDGDVSGYSILVDRYKDLAFTIAFRIIGNREDAEEITQDAFLNVYRGLDRFRGKAKFSTWLYRIVYNAAVSKKRLKKAPVSSIEDISHVQDTADVNSSPDANMENEERSWLLEKALGSLAEDEKTIVTLFYLNDASIEEIHTITGLSRANIKVKLFRARKRLQIIMTGSSSLVFV